ncbi:MAG TPA: hypothetical protein VHJ34_05705 [Actinomycetota bacterium]|nr:hypothetical protein [Actinomycetota bacterium]
MRNERMRTTIAAGGAAVLLGATMFVGGHVQAPVESAEASTTHTAPNARSREAIRLRNKMRKLWEDHIVWTRQFIVSAIADLPDAGTAAARLLANQDHIGNAIKPYYGDAAGERLSSLLRDHILIAADLLDAAKAGDSEGVEEANARWRANANDIAAFLHAANPHHWRTRDMRAMMSAHLDWTLTEATARLHGDWDGDVAAYDRIHRDILHMADMLSLGIVAQFPGKF